MSDGASINDGAKELVLADGMARVGSAAVAMTDKRHLAVRNAIATHRYGKRVPLAVSVPEVDA